LSLFYELAPQLDGAIWVKGAHSSQPVVFPRLDGSFRRVYSMVVWVDELDSGLCGFNKLLDGF
jgi:hypothetical protein